MGIVFKLILLLIPIGIGYVYLQLSRVETVPPELLKDAYWGPKSGEGKKEDASIRKFQISTPPAVIQDLKDRLKKELDSNRLVPPLESVGFEYGFNSNFLKKVGQYWLTKYDWTAREKLLNKYPQFKTTIGGLDIHYYHVKPAQKSGVTTRPLLLLHGWPGSIVEFQKIMPLLSEPKNSKYNYELIVPSLPGYGFSSGSSKKGLGPPEIANVFKRLMDRLGHKKYFIMGGDWGSLIIADMATLYPEHVLGAHSSTCIAMSELAHIRNLLACSLPSLLLSEEEAKYTRPFSEFFFFLMREMGYAHIQATKPDTVGTALTHSPIGLAAYILEKFSTWTNRTWIDREDGGLLENFTLDELLDNVMVYWVTGSITTSQRLYKEGLNPLKTPNLLKVPTNVPFDCQQLPGDLAFIPQYVASTKYTNIQRYTVASKGGHFGAFEAPDVVSDDAVSFFNSL